MINKLEITNIEHTGHGSATHPQNKNIHIHVLGAFPGDVIDAKIYKTIKNISYAEIEHIYIYSEHRNIHPIEKPFFSANSPWINLKHESELLFKEQLYTNLYPKIIKIKKELASVPESESRHYRNKVAYSFMQKKTGELCFALYSRGTNTFLKTEQKQNELVHPILEKAGKDFLTFFNQHTLEISDIKYLILRYSYFTNTVVAHILVPEYNRKKIAFKKKDLEKFLSQKTYIYGVLVSHSVQNERSAETTKDFYELGNIHIQEKILDKIYTYHPSLFFQIYPKAFEMILHDLRDVTISIPEAQNYPLLDLFAGVGVIGLAISDLVKQITGVEYSPLSGEYSKLNAKKNTIENFDFHELSVDEILSHITSKQILIVDPTRSGLSEETCNTLQEQIPEYIFYISCNPITQKRDIEKIEKLYEIIFARAYNLFPKTHHMESMIVLKRK